MSTSVSESSEPVSFNEAIEAVMPRLEEMKKNLRGAPTASRSSVEKLISMSPNLPDSFVKQTPVPTANPIPAKHSPTPPPAIDDGRLEKLASLKKLNKNAIAISIYDLASVEKINKILNKIAKKK